MSDIILNFLAGISTVVLFLIIGTLLGLAITEPQDYCVPQNEQQVRHYGTDHNGQLVCWVTEGGSSTGVIKVVEYQVIGKELKQ